MNFSFYARLDCTGPAAVDKSRIWRTRVRYPAIIGDPSPAGEEPQRRGGKLLTDPVRVVKESFNNA
jgi:hypothetical protein